MSDASEVYTLNSEDAAARCRELLTTDTPPPAGGSLYLRANRPPSMIITSRIMPYKRRLWSPAGVDRWCTERQPPRIRRALACLARLEAWAVRYREPSNVAGESLHAAVEEILAAGDDPGEDEP